MKDVLLDADNDLQIAGGDLVNGASDNQHQHHILVANQGEYRQYPEVGVGIVRMLEDDDYTETLLDAKRQLEYDGMRVRNIFLKPEGILAIDGEYKK